MLVQCVKRLNGHGNDHDEGDDDQNVEENEEFGEEPMPTAVWMRSSDDPLREDEIDDKQKNHACGHEDLRRDSDRDLGRPRGPDDSHHAGGDSGHAETKHHSGHDEFMAPPHVQLKNGHVGDGAEHEEKEKDGGDWDIEIDGWDEAQRRVGGSVWSMPLRHRGLGRAVSMKICGRESTPVLPTCLAINGELICVVRREAGWR